MENEKVFCSRCGAEASKGTRFCTGCGNDIQKQIEALKAKQQKPQVNRPAAVQAKPQAAPQTATPVQPQAVPAQPVKAPTAQVVMPKEAKKEGKAGKTILSVLCCLLIFVMSVLTLSSLTVRGSIQPATISGIVETVDIASLVEESELRDSISEDLSGNDIQEIYREGTIKDFVEDTLNDYAGYILSGTEPQGVDGDEVVDLLKENSDLIEEVSGKKLKERDYKKTRELFDDDGEETIGMFSEDAEMGGAMKAVRIVCSLYAVIGYIVILLLFVLLLFKIRKWHADTLLWSGITFVITSVLFVVTVLLTPALLGAIDALPTVVGDVAGMLMGELLGSILLPGGLGILLGVILIAVYMILKSVKAKKNVIAE